MFENVKATSSEHVVFGGDRFVSVPECSGATGHLAGVQGGAGGPVPAPARGDPAPQTAYSQTG